MNGPLVDMSHSENNKGNTQVTPSPNKKHEKAPIVELKNGKVLFKQKPISLEKQSETLQEIVRFREMLEERIDKQEPPLTMFPDEHKPLIAKLAHESDKTLNMLTKHIQHELLPTIDEEDDKGLLSVMNTALPLQAVEHAIKAVLTRNNYGLDAPLGIRLPTAVCVWRWEVRSEHVSWLPKNSQEKAELRKAERVQAKQHLKQLFEALTQEERDTIIDPKAVAKISAKDSNKLNGEGPSQKSGTKIEEMKASPLAAKKENKKKADEQENEQQSESKAETAKKAQDPEKAAKEKEKLEKKAVRAEKEKKEKDAQNKSKSIMANFFMKPKAASRAFSKEAENPVAGPSKIQSDFEKVFKPFILQKDKSLAPINWFTHLKKQRGKLSSTLNGSDIIVIDSDEEQEDVNMCDPQPSEQVLGTMAATARLQNILSTLPRSGNPSLLPTNRQIYRPLHFKTYHPVAIRDLISQLSEAEIAGDDSLVRSTVAKLGDRALLPSKVFIFHEDARPGYFGSWTRSSRIIGPRNPFAKDALVFDYGYDSGAEWEEEPIGDADDVVEDGEEEDGDGDDPDSDLDSWLVDDDDEPEVSLQSRSSSPPPFLDSHLPPPPKRKAEDGDKKLGKKRKLVVPLVPFAKGPCWETTIGKPEYEPFKSYTIQLFNDTPLPIDPFTYVSTCVEDHRASLKAAPPINGPKPDGVFVVPPLPPRLTTTTNGSGLATCSPNASTSSASLPKKAPATVKSTFPDTHLTLLLTKIDQLQATSITSLVESIYLDLREHKVKKIAIEAKVREVSEKCKEKKVWIVKTAIKQAHLQIS